MIRTDEDKKQNRRRSGTVLAAAVLIPLLLALLFGVRWTYYFDLNDDSLMKEILAGEFTGTPEIRNIQSLFPLTAMLGGLYRIVPGGDIYGIFLLLLQFGCLGLVIARIGRTVRRQRGESLLPFWLFTLLAVLIYLGTALYHLVYLQYSFTVGMLGATAAFLFLTMRSRQGEGAAAWMRELLPPVLLIWLGFLLRSEMMLFMAPFIGIAFLFRLHDLDSRQAEKGKVLFLAIVLVCAGLGAGWAADRAGYSSPEWRTFRQFFDARTQLYDFEKVPDYEGNASFYDSIGLDPSEVELIRNYNFGIDDRIDAQTLRSIADYAEEQRNTETPPARRVKNALWDLRHVWSDSVNMPYLPVLAALSALVLTLTLVNAVRAEKEYRHTIFPAEGDADAPGTKGGGLQRHGSWICRLLELFLTLAVSCGLLLYLYYNQRPVVRLTHSIYLAETVILVWMAVRETIHDRAAEADAKAGHGYCLNKPAADAGVFLILAAALFSCVWQIRQINAEQLAREQRNDAYVNQFLPYVADHPGNVYYTDVYSTVDYSDRVFGEQAVPVNWDLMGGWASKSPLEMDKLRRLGCTSAVRDDVNANSAKNNTSLVMQESLIYLDNCCVAAEAGEDMQWLVNYYAFRGTKVTMEEADRIGSGEGSWVIWRVRRADR